MLLDLILFLWCFPVFSVFIIKKHNRKYFGILTQTDDGKGLTKTEKKVGELQSIIRQKLKVDGVLNYLYK